MPIFSFTLGIMLFTGIICISATVYQSFILIENYNLKATLWKNTEEMYDGAMMTPIIVICSDPANTDPGQNIVNNSLKGQIGETLLLEIGQLKTALKVSRAS